MSAPSLAGSIVVTSLPSGPLLRHRAGKLARVVFGEVLEEYDGEVGSLRLRCGRVLLDPFRDEVLMRLCPCVHECAVRCVGLDPGLSRAVMEVRPLGNDMGLALELILPEPGFNVGRDGLSVSIGDDRSEGMGDPVAQGIVVRRERGRCGGGCVVGRGRRPGLEVFVLREGLGDEPGPHDLRRPVP